MAEGSGGNAFVAAVQALKDLRISPQISLPAAFIGVILLALSWAPDVLGVRSELQAWRPWSLLAAVAGSVAFIVNVLLDWHTRRCNAAKKRRRDEEYDRIAGEKATAAQKQAEDDLAAKIRFLREMTLIEQGVCFSFYARDQRAQVLSNDSDVLELARRGVLNRISDEMLVDGEGQRCSHYAMADWAWDYLRAHPEAVRPKARRPSEGPASSSE